MSTAATAPATATAGPGRGPLRLRGDLAIWIVILMELATFALLFLSCAFARLREPAVFAQGQQQLDLRHGALNTALLIGGSWCVARAVHALRQGLPGLRWLLAALACGAGFVGLKSAEFAHHLAAGINLSTDTFWMFYLLLAGFHYLHVVAALVLLALVAVQTARGAYGPHDVHAPETAAAFWHMVDLLWLVLFPLVYVMRAPS